MTEVRALAVAALRKLPKRVVRSALHRASDDMDAPCFVTACALPGGGLRYTERTWARFAKEYGLTWAGMWISPDGSQVTALSATWERDRAWFRRAARKRLVA